MMRGSRIALFSLALACFAQAEEICNVQKALTYYSPRSQSRRLFRQWLGLANDHAIHRFDECEMYGAFAITVEYQENFRHNEVANCLFGDTLSAGFNKPTIIISGSTAADRGPRDWLADYFGLPTDYQSHVSFDPKAKTALVDFDYYLGLNDWIQGLYFRVHGPVVHTRWDLGLCETIQNQGSASYPAGYFAPDVVERQDLVSTFTAYVSNQARPVLNNGVSFDSLNAGRMHANPCDDLTQTRLAEVRVAVGFDVLSDQDYHVALAARTAIPAGTRPKGEFLFEPIVGNGHHWELGAELQGHYTFYRSADSQRYASFYYDIVITTLFKTNQCRTFDICNSPASRYMLAERVVAPVDQGLEGNPSSIACNGDNIVLPSSSYTLAISQFQRILSPIANITKAEVKVGGGAQTDMVFFFTLNTCRWELDIGYNLWARTCSTIRFSCPCPPVFDDPIYALKGDAYIYGYRVDQAASAGVPLSATQSKATLFAGRNRPCMTALNAQAIRTNVGVDKRQFAYSNPPEEERNALFSQSGLAATCNDALIAEQTRTSIQPIHLRKSDVDLDASQSRGLTNTFFAQLTYHFDEYECGYIPFFGIGGSAEFADLISSDPDRKKCSSSEQITQSCLPAQSCNLCCNCIRCAFTQWSVIIKGGVTF